MATTKLTTDLDNIQGLSDTPNETEGLTADQLKAKFDKAGGDIKTYLNSTLTAELDSNFLLKATKGVGADINTGTDDTKYITSKAITDSSLPAKNGWSLVVDSWSYASATTINVPAGAAAIYGKGDKIKLTQTTIKYFYIVAVADTLLTVTGGSDYTVANEAISEMYYSHQSSPIGFPDYFNYNISFITEGAGTLPTYIGKTGTFQINGSNVSGNFLCYNLSGGTGGNGTGYLIISLPINASYTNPLSFIRNVLGTGTLYEEGGDLITNCALSLYYNNNKYFLMMISNSLEAYSLNAQSHANRHISGFFNYKY